MKEPQLTQEDLLHWYSKPAVQESILANAQGREVAVRFGNGGFGKRPDLLKYPGDIIAFVKEGATSFHISEEHWSNVLQINPTMRRKELDALRKGWDLVLDIDCDFLEYSKIAAHLLVQALQYHGIESVAVKFSGNHGFHLAVPFSAFPEKVRELITKENFPEGPRRVALYLKDFIRVSLSEAMLKQESIEQIQLKTGKPFTEVVKEGKFDPYSVLSIDTVLISSRHLYRSIYSFNEKSGLVSIPLNPEEILSFTKEQADPKKVEVHVNSYIQESKKPLEGNQLLMQAFDHIPREEQPKAAEIKAFQHITEAIPEVLFPPCIKLILKGMDDGKKRSLFILINFLTSCGWDYDMIEKRIKTWNQQNKESLKETLIVGQLRYHKQQQKKIMPPNCQNVMYYTDIRVCNPDNLCSKIKNPIHYALRKQRYSNKDSKKTKKDPIKTKKVPIS